MNKIRQSINRISCGLVMIGTTISPILLTSCDSNGIVFADYESYISENLIGTMHNKWGVDMMYYSTNEDVQAKFKNSYDVAIPSTYTVLDMIPQLAEYD
ncbi:hypothetical protein FACS1894218_3060 [Bacilli bacterium]|nr:hypothetical protein FACS1894218_3060 [Bacilli bacterium]